MYYFMQHRKHLYSDSFHVAGDFELRNDQNLILVLSNEQVQRLLRHGTIIWRKKWYLAITIKCVFCSSDTTYRSTIVFWLENKNWVFLSICWKTYLMTQKANISNFLGLLLINHFANNDLYKSNSEVSLHTLKDKLKAFDDFKNKQKRVSNNVFDI